MRTTRKRMHGRRRRKRSPIKDSFEDLNETKGLRRTVLREAGMAEGIEGVKKWEANRQRTRAMRKEHAKLMGTGEWSWRDMMNKGKEKQRSVERDYRRRMA